MQKDILKTERWVGLVAASMFVLQACGGGGGNNNPSPPPPPPPPPANRAPVINSPAAVNIEEGVTGAIYTVTATDPDGDPITLSLVSGGDAGLFNFNAASGVLSLNSPLRYAEPQDGNRDNIYEVTFEARDNRGGSARVTVRFSVQQGEETFPGMALRRVSDGFNWPLYLDGIPGTDRVVVLEMGGRARVLNPETGMIESTPFLNVADQISTGDERGLLGITFSPDFASDRTVYVNLTNRQGTTEIRRYQTYSTNPLQADPATMDIILTINQVDGFHNGGWMGFDQNGLLYVATGDGGGVTEGADQNAQDVNSLLGKMLRLDVSGDDFPSDPNRDYRIPAGNAFPANGSAGRPEIFALGLRNPWRASFDTQTGDLFIADVGQGEVEEVNRMSITEGGVNYGWANREGTRPYRNRADSPAFTDPVLEYYHRTAETGSTSSGRSITGGYVYRGNIEPIRNHYLFADFVTSYVWSVPVDNLVRGQTVTPNGFTRLNASLVPDAGTLNQIASFGRDNAGNVYIVSLNGSIFRIEGAE